MFDRTLGFVLPAWALTLVAAIQFSFSMTRYPAELYPMIISAKTNGL